MVKTKQKPIAALLSKSNENKNSFDNLSNVAVDSDLSGDDSWVIVKKQKVTILIPQLPSSDQCTLPGLDLSREQPSINLPRITNVVTNAPVKLPHQQPRDTCRAERNYGAMPLLPESDIQSRENVYTSPVKATSGPGSAKMDSMAHNIEGEDSFLRSLCQKESIPNINKIAHLSSRSFQREQSRANLPCCTTILDKTMRASNVKMKITKAGGLHKWLSSLGLVRFERIFGGKNLNNLQVANLSMSKLKDMGYHAVGPRRKLIHAIECLCQ